MDIQISVPDLINFIHSDMNISKVFCGENHKKFNLKINDHTNINYNFINEIYYIFNYKDLFALCAKKVCNTISDEEFLILLQVIDFLEDKWEYENDLRDDLQELILSFTIIKIK